MISFCIQLYRETHVRSYPNNSVEDTENHRYVKYLLKVFFSSQCETGAALINNINSLYVSKIGQGKHPVLFLHGLWGGGNYFREFDLSDISANPKYFVDELGFGKSPKPHIAYTPKAHCDAMMKSLPIDQKFIIIGHSFGALLACFIAKYYPERVEKLVLVSPVAYETIIDARKYLSSMFITKLVIEKPLFARILCFFSCRLKFGGLIYPFFVLAKQKSYMPRLTEHTWHSFYSTFLECLLSEPTFPIVQQAVQNFPTLLVVGDQDSYVNNQTIEKLASGRLEKIVVPGFGHTILFLQFEETLFAIADWLAQDKQENQ